MAFGRQAPSKLNPEKKTSFKDSIQSLKMLRPFFKLIWETSAFYTVVNIILRLFKAGIPLATLYVGKLIIDEVILQIAQDEKVFTSLWLFIGIEFGLAILSDVLNRLINLTDALLGDLFANKSSVLLIEKAATLDLAMFEDPEFYDRLERARRQTTTRVTLMSQVLSQMQDTITIIFLGVGLVVFEPFYI